MKTIDGMAALVVVALVMAGCGESQPPQASSAAPAAWRLNSAPADAMDIKAAKTKVKQGDVIALRGIIGGRRDPISPESGLVVLMDPSVPSCAAMPADHCPTPWDYCCEPAEVKTANSAAVQLRDSQGKALRLGPDDLKPLQTVVVEGEVGPRPNDQTLVVVARGVYVEPSDLPAPK